MHVTIELTKNPDLLNQYYKLREQSFRDKLGIEKFDGGEDELDKNSNILIARIGERCIGGVRICGNDENSKLPLEHQKGFLEQRYPALNIKPAGCCQWMRFTLCPELDIPKAFIQNQFILATAKYSSALGYKYGICVSSKVHHRFYKRTFAKYGYDYWSGGDVTLTKEGEFDDLEHLLYFTDLHSGVSESEGVIDVASSFHLNLKEQRPLYVCQRLPLTGTN